MMETDPLHPEVRALLGANIAVSRRRRVLAETGRCDNAEFVQLADEGNRIVDRLRELEK